MTLSKRFLCDDIHHHKIIAWLEEVHWKSCRECAKGHQKNNATHVSMLLYIDLVLKAIRNFYLYFLQQPLGGASFGTAAPNKVAFVGARSLVTKIFLVIVARSGLNGHNKTALGSIDRSQPELGARASQHEQRLVVSGG